LKLNLYFVSTEMSYTLNYDSNDNDHPMHLNPLLNLVKILEGNYLDSFNFYILRFILFHVCLRRNSKQIQHLKVKHLCWT